MDALTIKDLLNGSEFLAWPAVVYLFREMQKLYKEQHDEQKAQLELFQKIALKASEGGSCSTD